MKRLCSAAVVCLVLFVTQSAFGEGLARKGVAVSLDGDRATIYAPIEKGNFIFEPMFRYAWDDIESDGVIKESSSVTGTSDVDQSQKAFAIGMGVYRIVNLKEKVRLTLGAQFGYQLQEVENTNNETFNDGKLRKRTSTNDLQGPFIAPSIGLEYALTDQIYVGGRASIQYDRLTGDQDQKTYQKSSSGTVSETFENMDLTRSSCSTDTELYVKYYF